MPTGVARRLDLSVDTSGGVDARCKETEPWME
jgi:hypothetical protein